MGICGCGKEEKEDKKGGKAKTGIDCPLETELELIEAENIDADFSKASEALKSIEILRKSLSSVRVNLFLSTGSCSYKKPNLENSIRSFLWKLGVDTDVDL